jgi:hypothetical protein
VPNGSDREYLDHAYEDIKKLNEEAEELKGQFRLFYSLIVHEPRHIKDMDEYKEVEAALKKTCQCP